MTEALFTETDWAILVGSLQEADERGIESWTNYTDVGKFTCHLTAGHDRYEATGLDKNDLPQIDKSGFSIDGQPINPGPWLIVLSEVYVPSPDIEGLPERFKQFRGRVEPKSIKCFTLDEAAEKINVFYITDGEYETSPTETADIGELKEALKSLRQKLNEDSAEA
jgi:hypothetical protein